jgi:hypothetical protein
LKAVVDPVNPLVVEIIGEMESLEVIPLPKTDKYLL